MKLILDAIVDGYMFCDGDSATKHHDENTLESLKYKKIFDTFRIIDLKKVKNQEEFEIIHKAFKYAELYQLSLVDCFGEDSKEGKKAYKKYLRYKNFRIKTFGAGFLDNLENAKKITLNSNGVFE